MNKSYTTKEVKLKNPLQMAYIGDGVYELLVRRHIFANIDTTPNNLHKLTVSVVCANAQHQALLKIAEMLSEEEANIVRRGKNSTKSGIPRSCSPKDYRAATGLEALFGFLYLTEQKERIDELFFEIAKSIEIKL